MRRTLPSVCPANGLWISCEQSRSAMRAAGPEGSPQRSLLREWWIRPRSGNTTTRGWSSASST